MAFNIDIQYISDVERQLGLLLPNSYKQIMKEDNGGNIFLSDDEWELFPIPDMATKKRISRTTNNILYETKIAQEWENFPSDALAIASNGNGDYLIFFKEDIKYGETIYKWYHEMSEIEKISDSFDQFEIE